MAIVLINDAVKKYLLRKPRGFRERVREKFEYFESGIWEGRLRAKKLRGLSSQCVFEAAIEDNLRLLFTLGRPPETSPKDLVVYVWGFATHENLDRKRLTVAPENALFLDFRNYDETVLEDVVMDDLDSGYLTQERLTERARDESGQQRWYPVEEPEWRRIRRFARDEFELFLLLTPEQKEVLETPLPLLISGTAGSGKTTLAVYSLFRKSLRGKTKLFITYNRFLRNFAERLYSGLLNEAEAGSEIRAPEFFAFKDFALSLAGRLEKSFAPEKEVDFDRFVRMFASHPLFQKFDAALVWEEIRSILKGGLPQVDTGILERGLRAVRDRQADLSILSKLKRQFQGYANLASLAAVGRFVEKNLGTDIPTFCARMEKFIEDESRRPGVVAVFDLTLREIHRQKKAAPQKYLSFLEYEFLGRKKAPHFPHNRKELYPVIEWYQSRLDGGELWDELDLIREILSAAAEKEREVPVYDILLCDEIQDFTDIQIDLLLSLTADPRNVFFAGDTKQTINPSGFRWEEVKRMFHERGLPVPPLKFLTLNFRSSGSIVELSNTLLSLKEKYLGIRSDEAHEDWKYKGRPPTAVAGIGETAMLDILKTAGARRTILVRSEDDKRALSERLETELVFTIGEAKGLEFETVVLWKFCADRAQADIWKVILDQSRKSVHEARIRHEINLLYVGITRSQKDLIIYDGERPSVIWEDPRFREKVYATDDRAFIGEVWNVLTTPEDWIEQGRYYLEREFTRAAMECFKNGGERRLYALAAGQEAVKAGRFLEAASYFEDIGETGRAAAAYERGGGFRQALPLREKLGDREGMFRCRVEILRQEGKAAEAGRLYLERRRYDDALRCFHEADDHKGLAVLYHKYLKNPRQAAAHYELARDYPTAARVYRRMGMAEKAAELFDRGGDFLNAEGLWKKTRNIPRLLNLYEKHRRFDKLVGLYESQNDAEKAVRCLKQMKDPEKTAREADALFARRKAFPALVRYLAIENHARAAACYIRLGREDEALRHFKLAGDFDSAADLHLKRKDYRSALECFLKSERERKEGFPGTKRTLRHIRDGEMVYGMGREMFKQGRYEQAAALFSAFGRHTPELGLCHAALKDEKKAFLIWNGLDRLMDYERLIDIGLAVGASDAVARFIISRTDFLKKKPGWPIGPELKTSRIIAFMDNFLSASPDPEAKAAWGGFLAAIDYRGILWEKTLSLLESSGDVNAILIYMTRHKVFYPEVRDSILKKWAKEIPVLLREERWEGLAVRYFALEDIRRFEEVLPRLTLRRGNVGIFLAASDREFEKGAAWSLSQGLSKEAGEILADLGFFERAAEIFDRGGESSLAAEYYFRSGHPGRAASLYEKAGKFGKAGDAYDRAADYPNALRMYARHVPFPKTKYARTLEHAGDYRTALKYWRETGDRKAIERCLRKAGLAVQSDLPFPDGRGKRGGNP